MIEKIKKIKKNILYYSIALIIILIVVHLLLTILNLKFRLWVYFTVILVSIIGLIIGIIQKLKSISSKTKKIIGIICGSILIISIIFWKFIMLMFFVIVLMLNQKEHVVKKDGKKYVAYVKSSLLHTDVYYYDYINFLFVGNEVRFKETYDGSYDPIESNKNVEIQENINNFLKLPNESNTQEQKVEYEIIDESDILYQKQISSTNFIRVIDAGNILGQKKGIKVQKTTNGGNSWQNQLKNLDSMITVNNEAEFIFINEKVGFINNKSLILLGNEHDGLLVTVNGGESFKSANFIFPLDVKDNAFLVNKMPYLEGKVLKTQLFAPESIGSTQGKYYEFVSIDNGMNWVYNENGDKIL